MAIDFILLGKRIKDAREKSGMSQEELATLIPANPVHISNIENGKKAPSIDLLVEIANTLKVSVDDLLVDSLEYSASTADSEIHRLLLDCNKTELKILTENVRHLKEALSSLGI